MPVLPELDGIRRKMRLGFPARYRCSVNPGDAVSRSREFGTISVIEINDTPRHLQQGGGIGCRVVSFGRQPQQQRRSFARHHHAVRLGFAQDGQRISALQLSYRGAGRREEIGILLQLGSDQVRDHFRIGVGGEHVPIAFQACAQHFVILDDPVVYNGQPARNVRMRIAFARDAMRRPARMRDPRVATGLRLVGLRGQFRDPADRTQTMQAFLVDQRQPGRVVAPVLEPAQPFKKNGNDIAVRDRGDDATHD